jgi:hypothetical protein
MKKFGFNFYLVTGGTIIVAKFLKIPVIGLDTDLELLQSDFSSENHQ